MKTEVVETSISRSILIKCLAGKCHFPAPNGHHHERSIITINVPLFKKLFKKTRCARDNLRGQKSLGPLKMSLEMAHKVIVPQKKLGPKVS